MKNNAKYIKRKLNGLVHLLTIPRHNTILAHRCGIEALYIAGS
jgi:hypothetical protein